MSRWDSFGRSTLFAALAAAVWLPCAIVGVPWLGLWTAHALYLALAVALYVGGIAPHPARGFIVGLATACASLAVAMSARSDSELLAGVALVLAIGRSVFLYRHHAARAVVAESALFVGAAWFAHRWSAPTVLACALSSWAFFLVQSCFFLLPHAGANASEDTGADPFEEAHRRALALLEDAS